MKDLEPHWEFLFRFDDGKGKAVSVRGKMMHGATGRTREEARAAAAKRVADILKIDPGSFAVAGCTATNCEAMEADQNQEGK